MAIPGTAGAAHLKDNQHWTLEVAIPGYPLQGLQTECFVETVGKHKTVSVDHTFSEGTYTGGGRTFRESLSEANSDGGAVFQGSWDKVEDEYAGTVSEAWAFLVPGSLAAWSGATC